MQEQSYRDEKEKYNFDVGKNKNWDGKIRVFARKKVDEENKVGEN